MTDIIFCVILFKTAMTRKSKQPALRLRIPSSKRRREWEKQNVPNMVSEPHTERCALGYAGIARYSDRVSTDHFLSELDKACYREIQAK